jgi:RNA polymerase sigma-70 factor (ECF subfamily)
MSPPPPGPQDVASRRPFVVHWLHSLGVPAGDIDDVAQEVLCNAIKSLPSFDPAKGKLEGWLYTIIAREAAQYHAATARENARMSRTGAALMSEATLHGMSPEDCLIAAQREHEVHALLDELDPARRAVLHAHYFEGQSMPEVGESLAIPVGTAKTRLALGREDFDRMLKKRKLHGALTLPIAAALLSARDARAASTDEGPGQRRIERWAKRLVSLALTKPVKTALAAGALAAVPMLAFLRPAPAQHAASFHLSTLVVVAGPDPSAGSDQHEAPTPPAPTHRSTPAPGEDGRRKRALLQQAMLAAEHGDLQTAHAVLDQYDKEFPNDPRPQLRAAIDTELQKAKSVPPAPPK